MTEAAAPTPAPNDQQCLKFGCAALHYKTLATTTREELEQLNVALIFLVTVAVVFFLALIVVWFVAGNKLSCNPVDHDDDDDDHGHGDQKNKSKQQLWAFQHERDVTNCQSMGENTRNKLFAWYDTIYWLRTFDLETRR